ncbi:MAG TPA: DUF1684 domain-containing protein [Anaerolineales bacterium]|nr:DUF1684 domain-containing protein [Anaerolineales bacterium]
MTELEEFRKEKDLVFARHPQSPLTDEQKKGFTGLTYYPEIPDLRLELELDEFQEQDRIEMQTSTGDIQVYTRHGRITFEAEGEQVSFTIYNSQHGFFLPFVDGGAGKETYGAGRYLEPEPLRNGKLLVDFNMAYNPYCAYNELYSCPLTPWENRTRVPIRAGEMLPQGEWAAHES